MSKKEALVVVVPSSTSSSTSEPSLVGKEPNLKRKQRWIKLNEILKGNAKKSKTNDSTAYSYVTWNQVKTVFNSTNYVQPRRIVDDAKLNFLSEYLSFTTKCFGDVPPGKRLSVFISLGAICFVEAKKDDVEQGMAQGRL